VPEPACAPARAEVVFLGDQGGGWLVEGACRLRPREEVDVDAAHSAGTELDVARAPSTIGLRLLVATERRDQGGRDDARCSLCEDTCLRHADRCDIPDRVDARMACLELLELTGT
jgi:hypothetical protein